MPARRAYSVKELRRRLEQSREAGRIRTARWRARLALRAGVEDAVTVTEGSGVTVTGDGHSSVTNDPVTVTPGSLSPPHPPTPVGSTAPPSEKEAVARAVLRGFRDRGYKDDARSWALWRQRYPEVDLELEAYKIAEWLREPRNAHRKCNKAFLDNWFSGTEARRKRQAEGPQTAVSPKGVVVVGNGTYAPPAAFQRNLEKTYKSADDYTSEDLVKSDEARRRVLESLPARLRGKWNR